MQLARTDFPVHNLRAEFFETTASRNFANRFAGLAGNLPVGRN